MSRKEIGEDGIWTIPAERYKTKRPNFVPLSKAALAVIEAQPKSMAAITCFLACQDAILGLRQEQGEAR